MMDTSTSTTHQQRWMLDGVLMCFVYLNCIHYLSAAPLCLHPRYWGGLQACTKQPKFRSIALCIFKSQSGLWHHARAWCIVPSLVILVSEWRGMRRAWLVDSQCDNFCADPTQAVSLGMRMRYLQWKIEICEFWRQILPQTFVTSWILWGPEANKGTMEHKRNLAISQDKGWWSWMDVTHLFFFTLISQNQLHSTDKKMTSSNLNPQAVSFGKGYVF